ncbi:MAG: hypothetical protein N3C57_07215 [Aquificaceae bacterium]|nr:hypothetical protein [Aquificaceae bacterium]
MDLNRHKSSEENQNTQGQVSQKEFHGSVQPISLNLSINSYEIEQFKLHVSKTLVEIIKLEMENMPEKEWQKTMQTWKKICAFCKSMMKKTEDDRHAFYRKFKFDPTMIHISESVIEILQTAYRLGLMKEKDPPEKIIQLGLEKTEDSSKVIGTLKEFFLKHL